MTVTKYKSVYLKPAFLTNSFFVETIALLSIAMEDDDVAVLKLGGKPRGFEI